MSYGINSSRKVTHQRGGGGTAIIRNFFSRIARCTPSWDLGDIEREESKRLPCTVGDQKGDRGRSAAAVRLVRGAVLVLRKPSAIKSTAICRQRRAPERRSMCR